MTSPITALYPPAARDNWRWRSQKLSAFTHQDAIRTALLAQVTALDSTDYRQANLTLGLQVAELRRARITRAYDESAIRMYADNYSKLAARIPALAARAAFAESIGVKLPAGPDITDAGLMLRLENPQWWRRGLRKIWTRASENAQRNLGLIRKGKAPYCSDDAVRYRAAQWARGQQFLKTHVLTNEAGEQLELLDIAEHSLANPAIRRGELMVRARGFDETAEFLGHTPLFFTLTCPSRFHAQLAAGGANPAYARAVVRDAQDWLNTMWARSRAKLKKLSVLVYGIRVAEPHHDGTPHWHLLLYVRSKDADTVRAVITGKWLKDTPNEPGASARRVNCKAIDRAQGSGVGYIAKYLSKNIDAAGGIANERSDETEGSIPAAIERVTAWARVHGIRQFQQIGGPPVGLYREARRLRDPVKDADIERVRQCADRGDFRGFIGSVGGIAAGRRTNARLERCSTGKPNRYQEARPAEIIGIRYASAVVYTRPHVWTIERKGCVRPRDPCESRDARARLFFSSIFSPLGPVEITVGGQRYVLSLGDPAGWTNPNETSRAGPQ